MNVYIMILKTEGSLNIAEVGCACVTSAVGDYGG